MSLHADAGEFRTLAAGYLLVTIKASRGIISPAVNSSHHSCYGSFKDSWISEKGCFEVGRVGQRRCRAGTVWELGGVHLHQRQPEIDGGD